MIHLTALLHPQSCVDRDTVSIGRLSRIWQFASVIRHAKIGEECRIASCSIIDGSTIGDRCIVSHGAFIDPGMVLGNDVFVGPCVALANDFWPRTDKAGWFDINDLTAGGIVVTRIESGASIGANAVILPGLTIGAGAMIAAGAVVDRNVPALTLFRRDGRILPIDPARAPNRMRQVAG